jgi:membrane-associated protease RseP (regulator of RpoE activity)
VALTTSHAPLKVSCLAEGGAVGSAGAPSSVPSASGAGAVTGGVVGGAAVGAAFGATALAFIPVLGVITVLSGVAAGAATGQAVESRQQSIRYPELISVPMVCPDTAAASLPAGAALGLGIRGLLPVQARDAGVGERGAVLVTSVAAGGRAEAAGLRSGDVILAADGYDLFDAADFEQRVLSLAPGTPLTLRVWRDGQVLDLVLTRAAAAP